MDRRRLILGASLLSLAVAGPTFAQIAPVAEGSQMDDDRVWAIIDRTAVHEADTDRQTEALRLELEPLTADEVVAFTNTMQRQLGRAWRWDLWAVGYIIEGGMSDDGFEYFRRWLLSKGRAFFDQILAHPDDLADRLADGAAGNLDYEEFATVSWDVWGRKTGSRSGTDGLETPALQPGGQFLRGDVFRLTSDACQRIPEPLRVRARPEDVQTFAHDLPLARRDQDDLVALVLADDVDDFASGGGVTQLGEPGSGLVPAHGSFDQHFIENVHAAIVSQQGGAISRCRRSSSPGRCGRP